MYCPKCGEEIKDGSKFCKHCGSQIKQKNAVNNAASNNVNTSSNDDEKTKKIIIGVLIAAIVVLAIVFVGFGTGLFNGDSSSSATAGSQSQQAAPLHHGQYRRKQGPRGRRKSLANRP